MNRKTESLKLCRLGALVFATAALAPVAALASTAANTTIVNTATVSYNDGGGTAQTPVSATASVTVTLVASAPLLSSPIATNVSQGGNTTLSYTITGTANGPDTYTPTTTVTPTNVTASPAPTFTPASISLGGTTLAAPAVATSTTIVVPYDGVVSNALINGLAAGSIISIGGNVYTIGSITKNVGANTTTIGLTSALTGATVATGSVVGEQKTFSETVPSGTVISGSSGTESVTTTATSATSPNPATTQSTATVITVNRPTLTVAKTVSIDTGNTFAASANAPPGTALVYKIVASNTSAGSATTVAFSDVVPQYLTYVPGSGKYATATGVVYSAATGLTEGSGGYSVTGATVTYSPGSPGLGTVPASGFLVLYFKATIN